MPVILPLHPRTKNKLKLLDSTLINNHSSSVTFIEPLGYLDMVMLEKNARVVITDSGGVQKEAYFHGVPCVTVRNETEWVELVEANANILAGADKESIIEAFNTMRERTIKVESLYGDGNSAEQIVSVLLSNQLGKLQQ